VNEYLFHTPEGGTLPPNEDREVENCQLLGRVEAPDPATAKARLLAENPWIEEAGFDPAEIRCEQILRAEDRRDLALLLDRLRERGKTAFNASPSGGGAPCDSHLLERLKELCGASRP